MEHLQGGIEQRRRVRRGPAVQLGGLLRDFMDGQVGPRYSRFAPLAEVWKQLLPTGLAEHCEIVDLDKGLLTVAVDLAAYAYELRLCSDDLAEELQHRCPAARVRKIRIVTGL